MYLLHLCTSNVHVTWHLLHVGTSNFHFECYRYMFVVIVLVVVIVVVIVVLVAQGWTFEQTVSSDCWKLETNICAAFGT